ncbi:sugar porter family MFS transporter [Actinotalea sp. M2MS4P-6]|uniref:sugar porter family MFS transporter n=1 Tax=Actinotalea sp. M2MS4P-6 TaxID=2983762 RepID=UPI0021E3979A|nr:sugar porter family MFS transporter [Actinotalea sp. M2MS4P-6]MCV2394459.1 sugar porter family MFS transporter [Actinotalea sp. M2MS4P-6]
MEVADRAATRRLIDDAQTTRFVKKIVLFSSGGAFLDGYVLSIIGVALVQLTPALGLTDAQTAATGAAALAGIFFGSLVGGRLTDALGRRTMFILDVSAIGVVSLAACFVGAAWQLIVLRLLLGFFIGADYPIATSLIAEFSPRSERAIAMGVVSAAWYLGATAAAFVGFALYSVDGGWRWMLGSALVPCVALLIGRHDIPESPRWLAQRGQVDKAREVMAKVFGEHVELDAPEPAPAGFGAVFRQGYLGRIVYLGLLILCQVVPMYAMYTFGPSIIAAFGLGEGSLSVLGEAAVSLFFLIGTVPAMYWLNSMGRRPLLIGSLALMALGLLVPGIWPGASIVVIILAFGVYAFFSGGPGILQWLYPNEMFPTEVRATAVGVAIAISRIGVVVSTYGLPLFLAAYGIGPTMLVGAGLLVACLVLSIAMAPETRGLTLAEASSLRAG